MLSWETMLFKNQDIFVILASVFFFLTRSPDISTWFILARIAVDHFVDQSACNVAASYKPRMLVTRVQLPACAWLIVQLLADRVTFICDHTQRLLSNVGGPRVCWWEFGNLRFRTCLTNLPSVSLSFFLPSHTTTHDSFEQVWIIQAPHACDPGSIPGMRILEVI